VTTVQVKTVQPTIRRPHAAGRVPRPFPPVPPRTPAPLAIAPVVNETQSSGDFVTFALGAGAVAAFLLIFLGYAAPGLQTVRSQPGSAQPDPPG